MFDDITTRAIERAKAEEHSKLTRRDKVLLLLSDGHWHGGLDVALEAGGLGYRSRITELRERGIAVECRRSPSCPKGESWHEYRMPPGGDGIWLENA
jgi:hypothetical protein